VVALAVGIFYDDIELEKQDFGADVLVFELDLWTRFDAFLRRTCGKTRIRITYLYY